MHILVVEDDVQLAEVLEHILLRAGYSVEVVGDGLSGLHFAQAEAFDAIIFDVMLPELDGMSAVAQLRESGVHTPVLMLTALGAIPDRIDGLDSGADNYVTKPFSPKELLARLRALTRRKLPVEDEVLIFGDISLHEQTRSLRNVTNEQGDEIQLSKKEFLLARLLISHGNALVSREKIEHVVWQDSVQVAQNNIDSYISMLRKKLTFLQSFVHIKVERELGYRLEIKESQEVH